MEFANIKAVTFDAGGTLIEPWPSVGHVYSAVAAELGYGAVSPEGLNQSFAKAWKIKQSFDYSRSAWFTLVEQVFAAVPCEPDVPDAPRSDASRSHPPRSYAPLSQKLFETLYERFTHTAVWRVYDDVQPTLRALRHRGYRLGVISNWDGRLKNLLSDLQLSDYFEAIVLSVDVGASRCGGVMRTAHQSL